MKQMTFEEKYKGRAFKNLTILDSLPTPNDEVVFVKVKCHLCGNVKQMRISNVVYGFSKSCGCEVSRQAAIVGSSNTRLFIETTDGPLSVNEFCKEHDIQKRQVYYRLRTGRVTKEELLQKSPSKRNPQKPKDWLNGMTVEKAQEMFKFSRQTLYNRRKAGYTLNEKNEWITPKGKNIQGKRAIKFSKSKKATINRLLKKYGSKK